MTRLGGSLGLLAAGLCATVAVAELGLRLVHHPPVTSSGWRTLRRPDELPMGERNQLGFRGRPIRYADGDFVILILGDSQATADFHPFDTMPERLLEKHLERLRPGGRVKVFTAAAAGYGTDQEYLALQEYYRSHRADLVVVWETPANDVVNNLFPTHWPWNRSPKPTFWLDGGRLQGPAQPFGQPVPPYRLQALVELAFARDRDHEWEQRHLPAPYTPLAGYDGPIDRSWEGGRYVLERLDAEKSHLAMLLTPRSPRMQYGLDLTHALLTAIRDEAARHSARMVVFLAPAPRDVEPTRSESRDGGDGGTVHSLQGRLYRVSGRQYWANVDEMNRDLATVEVPVTTANWRTAGFDPHLNQQANEEVMADLARELLPFLERR